MSGRSDGSSQQLKWYICTLPIEVGELDSVSLLEGIKPASGSGEVIKAHFKGKDDSLFQDKWPCDNIT